MELRERLRSLATPGAAQRRFETPSPLPSLVRLENSSGCTHYCDKIYIDHHGQLDLKHFPDLTSDALRFLSLDCSIQDFSNREALFLDIETTGTAGGTGTIAFLVGLGFIETGYFQIRQFFLQDLAQEAAFLEAVADYSARFRYLITYNGKCFDAQILRTRYLMHRRDDPFCDKKHIDMLFIARRLWKRKFRDCDLMSLEENVLQFHRNEDIPGYLIPSAYTDYLRFASGSLIQKVLHHNQWDILSLAVLTARACLLENGTSEISPEEHFSLSLLFERHKQFAHAIQHQIEAANQTLPELVMMPLARNLRRMKDLERMKWLLKKIPADLDSHTARQMCILCEHDLKDYELAIGIAEQQILKLEKFRSFSKNSKELLKWHHRRDRLRKKSEKFKGPTLELLNP